MELVIGKEAAKIDALDLNGKPFKIEDYKGKKLIVFFYPKDNTPVCTIEVQNFRDNYKTLKKEGFEVIGISADSIASHKKFIDKYNLPFILLSDESKETLSRYDVWKEKSLFGMTYMGILRRTFVIDENGKLEHIIEKVISRNAAEQIKSLY
ncbi:MAG: peroxiredoxin [Bacteroidetes bacterium]|nr:peroxiredoxin [Bacteroidota bacterium]